MNITTLKDKLSRKFRGASLDDVQGIQNYSLFGETAGNLMMRIDPMETVRHSEINIFDGIYDYASPTDLKGKKIIDIRPQVNRLTGDNSSQTFIEDFDRDKEEQKFSVEFDEATKFIRYKNSVGNSIIINETATTNWTAGTGVSNIAEDTILFAEGNSSLRFDASSGTNLLTWAGTAVDISAHTQKGSFFMWVYYPDSSLITSLKLRIGSSSANYYEITGSIHFGSIRSGWNLYRFDWNGATDAGTTDEANTDYARFELTTTSADTDIRFGRLSSKLPSPHEFVYYSNAIFRPSSGSTWLTQPTADGDILNLEHDAENIYIYECCATIASDLQRYDDMTKFNRILGIRDDGSMNGEGLYGSYKKNKPSEAIRPSATYYKIHSIRK